MKPLVRSATKAGAGPARRSSTYQLNTPSPSRFGKGKASIAERNAQFHSKLLQTRFKASYEQHQERESPLRKRIQRGVDLEALKTVMPMNFDVRQVSSSNVSHASPKRSNMTSQKPTPDDTMRQASKPQRREISSFTQAAKPTSKTPKPLPSRPTMGRIDLLNSGKTRTSLRPTYGISTPSNLARRKSSPSNQQRLGLKFNLPDQSQITESEAEPSKPMTNCPKKTKKQQRALYEDLPESRNKKFHTKSQMKWLQKRCAANTKPWYMHYPSVLSRKNELREVFLNFDEDGGESLDLDEFLKMFIDNFM